MNCHIYVLFMHQCREKALREKNRDRITLLLLIEKGLRNSIIQKSMQKAMSSSCNTSSTAHRNMVNPLSPLFSASLQPFLTRLSAFLRSDVSLGRNRAAGVMVCVFVFATYILSLQWWDVLPIHHLKFCVLDQSVAWTTFEFYSYYQNSQSLLYHILLHVICISLRNVGTGL